MRSRGRIALLTIICLSIVTVTLAPSLLATPGGVASSDQLYDCGGSCHNKPSTASLTMWASTNQVSPGGLVDVIVNVSGGQAVDVLGVMIVSVASPVQASSPTAPVNGWVIRSDPGGGTVNYYETTTYLGSASMRWQLDAPTVTGSYSLYARTMHGGGAAYAADYSAGVTFFVGNISTTGPTVIVSVPASGSTVKGVVSVEASVLDNASMKYVVVKLDGVEIANKTNGPFTWSLESTIYEDGDHTLNVTAVDVNGKVGYHQITITIDNAPLNSGLLAWVWTMAAGTVAILAWVGVLMVIALMVRRRHIEGGVR